MKRYIRSAVAPDEYNNRQTQIGSPLKTYKGSVIKRSSKYGVGKEIGGDIYFHKNYADIIVPPDILYDAKTILSEEYPYFRYNCMRYSPKTGAVSFQESPDFDTAREPIVGDYITIFPDGSIKTGHSNYIFHHKWLWVKNDYPRFDTSESWEWSREWLNTLQETSDGNGIGRWNAQLNKYNLPIAENRGVGSMKRYIKSAELDIPRTIVPGMFWCEDEFTFTVTNVSGDRATVVEEWIAYDTGESRKETHKYRIGSENGTEYVYDPQDPEWRFYASSSYGV